MSYENHANEVPETKRPLSPSYYKLKEILAAADVLLLPTDRDLAPPDHHNDTAGEA